MADPPLNSLDRFRKQPGRLVFEDHGHCEVPAGCGGVILRWRDPFASVPATFWFHASVPTVCALDGKPLESMRADLVPGSHAFTFHLETVPSLGPQVLFALTPFPQEPAQKGVPAPGLRPPALLSRGDGTWRFTQATPEGEAWKSPGFDDCGWQQFIEVPMPDDGQGNRTNYQLQHLIKLQSRCLGASGLTEGPLWGRVRFDVPPAADAP